MAVYVRTVATWWGSFLGLKIHFAEIECCVVLKRSVSELFFWDPWSPKLIIPVSQCPCIKTSLYITSQQHFMEVISGMKHSWDLNIWGYINAGTL